MFLAPYSTTALSGHQVTAIAKSIQDGFLNGRIRRVTFDSNDEMDTDWDKHDWSSAVCVVDANNKVIPDFYHPIIVQRDSKKHADSDDKMVVFDARHTTRLNIVEDKLVVTPEYNFQKMNAMLIDKVWIRGNQSDLFNCGDFQIEVFAHLLASTLERRMTLDKLVSFKIQTVAAFYYLSLFDDKAFLDDVEHIKRATQVSRAVRRPLPDVLEILGEDDDKLPPPKDLKEFCTAIATVTQSIRLKKFSAGLLVTMLGGIWRCPQATEVVAVSLEYPPTWCAMLSMAFSDRSFSSTILKDVAHARDKISKSGADFTANLRRAIKY